MRPGRERRATTRRIREINGMLAETLAPEIARIEAQVRALSAQPPAEDVLEFRGYPYFLFDPREVAALAPGPFAASASARESSGGACDQASSSSADSVRP